MLSRKMLSLMSVVAIAASSCGLVGSDDGDPAAQEPPADPLAFNQGALDDAEADKPRTDVRVAVPEIDLVLPRDVDESDVAQVFLVDLFTDGLTEFDADSGYVRGALAESWDVSDDRLVWTFELRDVDFTTGERIEADDVVASIASVAEQGPESLSGSTLWAIDGFDAFVAGDSDELAGLEAVDEDTLTISLSEPFESLPEALAAVPFGVVPAGSGDGFVGSSWTFTPERISPTGGSLLRKVPAGEGELESIAIDVVDPEDLSEADVDIAVGFDAADVPSDFSAASVAVRGEVLYGFNFGHPVLANASMRKAVDLAVDGEALREEFFPESTSPCGDDCEHDPELAADLVAKFDGEPSLTVDYFVGGVDDEREQLMAEAVADQLVDAGFEVEVVERSLAEFSRDLVLGDLAIFRFGALRSAAGGEASIGAAFARDGADNVSGFASDEVDDLLAAARVEEDPDERRASFDQARQAVQELEGMLQVAELPSGLWVSDEVGDVFSEWSAVDFAGPFWVAPSGGDEANDG